MPTAEVDGLPIRYEDDGDGPPVLFCHGFLMDRTMFDPQVETLTPGYRCLRLDERGFGGTPVDGPFDYWDLADDAVGVLDHADVDDAVWVGMSQGGFLALRAALAHPERVRGLVLVDTDAATDDEETREGYRQMFRTWFEHGPVDPLVEEVAGLILGGDEELRREWIARWREIPPERLRLPAECLLGRDDLSGRLAEITAPALVVHGTEDRAIPMERAEALDRGLPNSVGLLRVEGAAHAPNLTHPEVVNPRLRAFLEAHA
ncbi:MAG: alpha/beta fold hydrolase [Gemmatimonadota bacterium]